MFIKSEEANNYLKERNYPISSITKPADYSIVYISLKIADQLENVRGHKGVFVFAQNGLDINEDLEKDNIFCMVEDPSRAFAGYVEEVYGEKERKNRTRKYTLTDGGYTVGENVSIGENTYIEPGVLIDHDVVIGKDCVIKFGAVLRNCVVGNGCNIYEAAIVGNEPYNFHPENGHYVHSIAVGKAVLKDMVDVGAHSIVDRGTITDTTLYDDVKLDTYVHIGHDAVVGKGSKVTSSSIVGGFCEVGENSEICTAVLRKRIKVGNRAFVGLNSGVLSDVADDAEVFGYPARLLKKGTN